MDSWREESLDGFDFSVLETHSGLVKHNMLRMQSIRYITSPNLIWTFAILFSPEIGKSCVISYFTMTSTENAENQINEILYTIRFK